MATERDTDPLTFIKCGPQRTCPDGTPHDYSKWRDFVGADGDGGAGGTAVCAKCGHEAFDNVFWD